MGDGALIALGTGGVAAAGLLSHAVRGRSSSWFAPSVYHGDRLRAALALTFDDGPSESTPALLELLAAHRVPATFFMCGENVRRCPRVAREVADAGHEIGNHTDSHPRLDFHGSRFIAGEIARAQETIHAATGATPRLFRAPYGVRWFGLRSAQRQFDLMGVMWTVIGRDWKLTAPQVHERVLRESSNGGIICLHDGRGIHPQPDIGATLNAVKSLIPALKERGYQFQTVSEILCPTN